MNKKRLKALESLVSRLEGLRDELETIKASLNLFNTVKTLCKMNLMVENNGDVEINSEFSEEFIDNVQTVADSHVGILPPSAL